MFVFCETYLLDLGDDKQQTANLPVVEIFMKVQLGQVLAKPLAFVA
jgi:hypothetical protein